MVDFTKFESVITELNKIGNPILIYSPEALAIVTYVDALEEEEDVNLFKQKIMPVVGFLQMLSIESPHVVAAIEKLQNIQYHPDYDYHVIIITPEKVYSGYVEVGPEVQDLTFFSSEVFENKKTTTQAIEEVIPYLENPQLKEKYSELINAITQAIPEATVRTIGDELIISAWSTKLSINDTTGEAVLTVGEIRDKCWAEKIEEIASKYVKVERR